MNDPLVIDLSQSANLAGATGPVDFRFTHGSLVFLVEQEVYKVKRAKDFGFFDYSTLAARKHFCAEEVRLNRRGAGSVYRGVVPVLRDDRGHFVPRDTASDEPESRRGEVVDYAVHMARLPDGRSARSLLRAGLLGAAEVQRIADRAVEYYRDAEVHPPAHDALCASIEENFAQVQPMVGELIDAEAFDALARGHRGWFADHRERLSHRESRDGHGDLRLEHVYLLGDEVLLIDCIEFLDRFRIADPALDAGFIAMDLHREGHGDLAEVFLRRFAERSLDYGLYPLIDGYMSYRALVRGKVAGFVALDPATDAKVAEVKRREAREMMGLAATLLDRGAAGGAASGSREPRLIAVGGLIAAGKSTVARRIGDGVGAPVVCADAVRHRVAESQPDGDKYGDATGALVHDLMIDHARAVLSGGRTVVVDTTFRSRGFRDRVRALAEECGAGFAIVECRATETELRRRLALRERGGGDASGYSDAREDLLDAFMADFEPFDEVPGPEHVILDTAAEIREQDALLAQAGLMPPR